MKARLRNRNLWLGVGAFVFLVLSVTRPLQQEDQGPLALDSTAEDGTKAMVYLLDRFGTDVRGGVEPRPGGRALLIRDDLGLRQSEELQRWVEEGGTLIVSDPRSSLSPFASYTGRPTNVDRTPVPACESQYADGVNEIAPFGRTGYESLAGGPGATSCFRVDGGHFLQQVAVGRGQVVALAGPGIFTNERLGDEDNAVLVANLLSSPDGVVTVVQPRPVGEGDGEGAGLGDLVPDRVINAIWQLVIAGVLFVLWRGRRLGRPMEEELPVEIPGSALTVALADLLQTAGRTEAAAHIMRRDLRRQLSGLLGLRPDTSAAVLAEIASERTGVDRRRLQFLLTDGPPPSADDLLRLSQELEVLHQEVANVR